MTSPSDEAAVALAAGKPRLVLLRWPRAGLPGFIRRHLDEQVACLRLHFDVVVVSGDCDYREVCETHRPDMALFESGVYAGPRRITGTSAHPEIPKVGFCNADAYCATRSVFLSDMERWGVETFFTLSVAMAEYTPDIADRLFVWPNSVDPEVYRDYGRPKNIPVLFTGSQETHYPWRSRVHSAVTPLFPCLTTPHAGWFDEKAVGRMVHGARYAELINAASVAPTCGTIAREVIRKHFEIPASRTCLVTERTRSIEAAGFVDMENVVFAEPGDVVDKLEHLFSHPEELRRITDAGFALVHARHTMAARDQLLQWFRLQQAAGPGERIVQSGPFDALRLVPASSVAANTHPISGALDRGLLHDGERQLARGRHERARELFLRSLNYHFVPEPVLGLTRCDLYAGDATAAAGWVTQPIERSLVWHLADDPDPVEWAFFVRTLLCQGEVEEAARRAAQFPHMCHQELDRIRRVASAPAEAGAHRDGTAPGRASVHVLPERDTGAWVQDLQAMLRACGKGPLADAVPGLLAGPARAPIGRRPAASAVMPLVPVRRIGRLRRWLRSALGARWRALTAGAPHAVVRRLAQKEDVDNALLIGASATARCTRAVLSGLRTNPNQPGIFWLRDATPARLPGRDRRPGERLADTGALARRRAELEGDFDVVVVGEHRDLGRDERAVLAAARLVVLTGINRSATQRVHSGLIEDRAYALVTHHDSHDGGYSVFKRLPAG